MTVYNKKNIYVLGNEGKEITQISVIAAGGMLSLFGCVFHTEYVWLL